MDQKLFVISLGGSLIAPEEIDTIFLKKFKKVIDRHTKAGNKFIIMTGGGKTARKYQAALKKTASVGHDSLDWIGIQATWLNAKLVQLIFGQQAHLRLISDPNKRVLSKEKILVAGGWKPGRSTDDDAVRLAKTYGAKLVINLSNVDYVYTKDPRKFKDAKKIENIFWKEFINIIGSKWDPGKNVPFDPTAAKFAKDNKINVIIANGKDFKNLQNILSGKRFKGTIIK